MTPGVRRALITAVPVALVAAAGWVACARVRQARLDRDLVSAVFAGCSPDGVLLADPLTPRLERQALAAIEDGADPNARRPVPVASQWDRLWDALLARKRPAGMTVIAAAASRDQWRIVEALVRHGANPNVRDDIDRTPLQEALGAPDADLVALLADHGADVNAPIGGYCPSPLIFAVGRGMPENVRVLLAHGAEVGFADADGETAMHNLSGATFGTIVIENWPDDATAARIARMLIEAGADPTRRDRWGRTPRDMVRLADRPMPRVTRLLRQAEADWRRRHPDPREP